MEENEPNEPQEPQDLIIIQPIDEELQVSYLDYAMSVIVGRALPDVRDGLKPVHRRILYAMNDMGIRWNTAPKKCARIVGETLGKYHPHGDQSVYDALVRLGQDFSLREPLIQGQGNFGSIDGDPPAAMRYCVTADTMILTDKGMMPIQYISNEKACDIDVGVLSIDGGKNRAIKFFDSGEHPTIKIETANDFSLEGSYNHPILTWRVGSELCPMFSWKTLENLEIGDIAVLNRGHELFAQEAYNLTRDHIGKGYRNHVPLPYDMNEELAFLLGALVSEGSFHQKQILFCNSDRKFYDAVKNCVNSQFPGIKLYETRILGGCYQFSIYEQRVVQFLVSIGLKNVKSKNKIIPYSVLQSKRAHVRAFLIALFEGDGSVQSKIDKRHHGKSVEIFYTSLSRKLIDQLKIVLLNFGIASNIINIDKRNGCNRLVISNSEHIGLFDQLLGFFSDRKGQILASVQKINKSRMSKTDFIPFLNDYLRCKYSHYLFQKYNFDRYNRLEETKKTIWHLLDDSDKKLIEWLLTNHYLFTPISSIKHSKKEKKVFSVKVDSKCHSFVANGFVNHNTEARLAKISEEMLQDIDKETVEFVENFDGSLKEPSVLPAKLPNLLINGSSGIAVGMATNIPPHNLMEVSKAAIAYINNPEMDMFELAKIIQGPDFPTGGIIQGRTGIMQYFNGGRGKITVRAVITKEEGKRTKLIITEIPYMVNKSALVKEIADAVKSKKIEGISDILDESDRKGMRVVIVLKQGATAEVVENVLYKHTRCQTTFGVNNVCLVDGQPKTLGVREILEQYVKHRRSMVRKRTEFDLKKAKDKAHLLAGLVIALNNIDSIVDFLKKTRNVEEARQGLMQTYNLSEKQSNAILEMRLSRLTGLEQEKIREDLKKTKELIAELEEILASEQRILDIIKDELREIMVKFNSERRTQIRDGEVTGIDMEDLIEPEDVVVTISNEGYCKRLPVETYRAQNRGGKGVIAAQTKDEDFARHLFIANTHTWLLIFTDKGKIFWVKVYNIPEGSRQSKGKPIINIVNVSQDEKVRAVIPVKEFSDDRYLLFVTKQGLLKKTVLSAYKNVRQSGIIAINILENDNLIDVLLTREEDTVMIASARGMAVKCAASDARPMGRGSKGVRGIRLAKGDSVVNALVVKEGTAILSVTENGYGKRTRPEEYRMINRGGKGVRNIITSDRNGLVVSTKAVGEDQDMMFITRNGITLRTPVTGVRIIGRNTQGVKLMNMKGDDKVVACTLIDKEEIEELPEEKIEKEESTDDELSL